MKKILNFFFSTTIRKILSTLVIILIIVTPVITVKLTSNKYCYVTFDVAGGTKVESQKIKCGKTATKPDSPVKKGFDFLGWYLEENEYDFSKPVKKDIILKAHWKNNNTTKTFNITFDSAGGSKVDTIEISEGEILTEPIPPTKKGYVFKGWYLKDSLYIFSFVILQDITLTARWEKENNKSEQELPTNNNSINQESNNLQSDFVNEQIENLLGIWYYEEDSNVFIRVYYGYIDNIQHLYVQWYDIDVFKAKIYPNYAYNQSYIIEFPITDNKFNNFLKETNIKIENNKIKIGKYTFSQNIKEPDLSEFDKYIGIWYLVGADNNNTFIEINKERDIGGIAYRITTESNYFPAEGISQKNINEGTHIFNKYNITYNNGYLIYNGKTYSKEKNKEVIHLDDFTVMFGMNTSNSVYLGKTKQYYIQPYPNNATALDGTWTSKDTTIAKVDNNGLVTGVKVGTTEICFKSNDLKKIKCEYINVENIKVSKIIPTQNTIELNAGETKTINYTIDPVDATLTKMYLDTDNYDVAAVGDTTIYGKTPGTATITITYSEDRNVKAEVKVIVKAVPVSNIIIDKESIDLVREKSVDLTATITPNNATNKEIIWTSSDENVAIVSKTGKVTATGQGTAIITAKTVDGGYTANVQINVTNPPLKATNSVGMAHACNNNVCGTFTFVEVLASGGSGNYTYSITVKKDGKLLGTFTKPKTYLTFSYGAYEVNYKVTDSLGKTISGSKNTTISK